MNADIQVYENTDFGSIRAFEEDGEIWFVASDVAKILGYHEAKDLVRSLDNDEIHRHTVPTNKGSHEAWVISEPGFYHAILMRKSACVKDPEARARVEAFQRWVTHEVLPSIRNTGAYINPAGIETPEELYARALKAADVFIAKRDQEIKELQAKNDAMQPKAAFADAVAGAKDGILVGVFSAYLKERGLDIGRNRLFEKLRDDGFVKKNGSGRNLPTQRALELGVMSQRESVVHTRLGDRTYQTPLITGKGQQYFFNKYAGAEQ